MFKNLLKKNVELVQKNVELMQNTKEIVPPCACNGDNKHCDLILQLREYQDYKES